MIHAFLRRALLLGLVIAWSLLGLAVACLITVFMFGYLVWRLACLAFSLPATIWNAAGKGGR